MRRESLCGVVVTALMATVIVFSAFNNCFLGRAVFGASFGEVWKLGSSSDTYIKMFDLQASDGSIRLIQPNESIVEGVVSFRIEIENKATGAIRDVDREFLLKVQPRDADGEGDRETYAMKIVGRTILDFPNYAVFIDMHESIVNTTVFYDGWHTVEVVYLEDGENVDSVRADFYFENGNEPAHQPVVPSSPKSGTVPSTPLLTEIVSVLLVIVIASLSIYFFFGRRERERAPEEV